MSDKIIWDFLLSKIKNPYGVAGLMGNLYVESKLNPTFLQGTYAKKFNMTGEQYTQCVDCGKYTEFATDDAGYGLAQWTYKTRKLGLISAAVQQKKSIGDLELQLDYLWTELQSYKTVLETLKTAKTVRIASDIVVKKYEKPKNQGESFLKTRAEYGLKFYDKFMSDKILVVPTTNRVNVRCGNGMKYSRIKQVNETDSFEWVTTVNGWHAIVIDKQVGWISAEFSKVQQKGDTPSL